MPAWIKFIKWWKRAGSDGPPADRSRDCAHGVNDADLLVAIVMNNRQIDALRVKMKSLRFDVRDNQTYTLECIGSST